MAVRFSAHADATVPKMLCFGERGTVVASRNDAAGTVIEWQEEDIRVNVVSYPQMDRLDPNFLRYLRKHRNKKYWRGYALKPVQAMIEMQLKGEI